MNGTRDGLVPTERAVGTARMATEFLYLLPPAQGEDARVAPMPVYFLIGHALELAFKSLLILEGTTDAILRKLGHDVADACSRVPERYAALVTPVLAETATLLMPIYATKGFEYLMPGFRRVPIYHEVRDPLIGDITAIRQAVDAEVREHLGMVDN